MRGFLSPRWLALHALALLAVAACAGMSWWQLARAQGGNAMSWGYTFEWPVFGVFAIAFWVKLIRDERRRVDPELDEPEPTRVTGPVLAGVGARPVAARPGPDRIRRVERVVPVLDDSGDDELTEYNRYLAWRNANPTLGRADYPG